MSSTLWSCRSSGKDTDGQGDAVDGDSVTSAPSDGATTDVNSSAGAASVDSAVPTRVPPPPYVGKQPEDAALLHQLAPERFTSEDPTSPIVEVVYDMGYFGTSKIGRGIHVGAKYVYWETAGRLMRGPKDGTGPVEHFGDWSRFSQDKIRSDSTHVYWINNDKLSRRPHESGALEEIPLPWDHTDGDLQVGERFVYVAMPGCPSLVRIDKLSLERDIIYATAERPSNTSLLLHDGHVFCGGDSQIFQVKSWEDGMQVLTTSPYPVTALAAMDGFVYGYAAPRSTEQPLFLRALLSDSGSLPVEHERLGYSPTSALLREVEVDQRGALVFATGFNGVASIMAFLPENQESKVIAYKVGSGGGIDADDEHYYFTHLGECCVNHEIWDECSGVCCNQECSAVVRIPIDAPFETIPEWR